MTTMTMLKRKSGPIPGVSKPCVAGEDAGACEIPGTAGKNGPLKTAF